MNQEAVKTTPANFEMEGTGLSNQFSLSCEYDGAQFHIWIDPKTLLPVDSILYKNPLKESADQFDTRTLDQAGGTGRVIVPLMLAKAKSLLPGLKKKLKYEADEARAHYENNRRDGIVRAAAPALYAFAKEIAAAPCYEEPGEYPDEGESGTAPCLSCRARAAIAKAEGI